MLPKYTERTDNIATVLCLCLSSILRGIAFYWGIRLALSLQPYQKRAMFATEPIGGAFNLTRFYSATGISLVGIGRHDMTMLILLEYVLNCCAHTWPISLLHIASWTFVIPPWHRSSLKALITALGCRTGVVKLFNLILVRHYTITVFNGLTTVFPDVA
jgi:hypothetical protein